MSRDPQVLVFVGINNVIVALDERTGVEVWRTKLAGADYVTVLWDGEALLAANRGEVWRLDPQTGAVAWHNGLKGLGLGLVSLASSRHVSATGTLDAGAAAKRRRDEQSAAE